MPGCSSVRLDCNVVVPVPTGHRDSASDSAFSCFSPLLANFAAVQVVLPANLRFCLFRNWVRPGQKCCLTTKSTKVTSCVFVPFVAIPGKRPAAEFAKSSTHQSVNWDEAHPGARASRPHQSPPSLVHLLHPGRPATAPGLCFGRAHAVPAGRVPHRRETERHRTGVHAGGTPALPGGVSSLHSCFSRGRAPACRATVLPMRQSRHAWWPFVDNSLFF